MSRRGVRVKSQLKSHKRFAQAFMTYCNLVDNARLYCTNALEGPAKVQISLFLPYSFFKWQKRDTIHIFYRYKIKIYT